MISKVEVERFSLTSSRSFDEVLAAINGAVGHPEMGKFWSSTQQARTVGELEGSIKKALGRIGLMSFVQFDHGAIVRKATGRDKPRMVVKIRFVEKQPPTTWNLSSSSEYGFYSNVNPEVDHPRWSLAKERRLGELFERPTLKFNGYEDQVGGLYTGMNLRKNF
jgi:hypothetical protein